MKVIVIGAGIIGLTTARALHQSGHQVVVLDAQAQAAQGCSAANGGFLAPTHCVPWAAPGVPWMAFQSLFAAEAPMRLRPPLSRQQLGWMWRMLKECNAHSFAINRDRMQALGRYSQRCQDAADRQRPFGYSRHTRGVLQLSRSAASAAALRKQVKTLASQGIEASWRSREEVLAMEPGLNPALPSFEGALHVLHEGSGQCERYCELLAQELQRLGVLMHWRTRVNAVTTQAAAGGRPARVTGVHTQHGVIEADACVVATGPDVAALLAPLLKVPVSPVKGYSLTLQADAAADAPRHAVLDEHSKLAIAPFDDAVVRVAGFADVMGHDQSLDTRRTEQLARGFKSLYPQLRARSDHRYWTGLRPMTPDGTPIVGKTSIDGLYLNCGHGTYGWTLSFGSAQLLADLINQLPTQLNAADYALARFAA